MKIGVIGNGNVPYHKVIYRGTDGDDVLFYAYDGLHEFSCGVSDSSTWSSADMSIEAVSSLLAEIRGVVMAS